MPARIGRKTKHEVVGPYEENSRNDNGSSRLIDICRHNSLVLMNGYVKHKEIHCISVNGDKVRSKISKRLFNNAANN